MNTALRCVFVLLALFASGPLLAASASDCAEGCTPGYWKNHPERWDGVGTNDFTLTIKHHNGLNAVLGVDLTLSGVPDSTTLLQAASAGGGHLTALNRHTAAALASADTAIFYPYSVAQVIALYRDAVGAVVGDATVASAHKALELANELGCPLSNSWQPSGICTYCFGDESDCPCGADFASGGCKNSTGQGGLLSFAGSADHAADDLVLTASQLPSSTPIIWIMAPAATRQVLRDGLLCLSSGHLKIIRFPTMLTTAGGTSVLGPGIVQMSIDHPVAVAEIFPGTTWNFQAYYRDNGSPCGGDANLTNAAQVNFY
jgi:hypothetical protein